MMDNVSTNTLDMSGEGLPEMVCVYFRVSIELSLKVPDLLQQI